MIDTGGPAFPQGNDRVVAAVSIKQSQGMTVRQYASIHLKVPNSGTDWLDDMIRQSLRDDFAAKAMQSYLALDVTQDALGEKLISPEKYCAMFYQWADHMLKAREQ